MQNMKTLTLLSMAAAAALLGSTNAQAAGPVILGGTVQAQTTTSIRSGLVPPTSTPVVTITAPVTAPTAPWTPPPAPPRRRR